MTFERAKEIGTHGGCGLVACAILDAAGRGTPLVRYRRNGEAVHAAVLLDGIINHLGDDDEGFVEVSREELERACREDFYADRVQVDDGELDAIASVFVGRDEWSKSE